MTTIGHTKGDTRSLDYSSMASLWSAARRPLSNYCLFEALAELPCLFLEG